MVPHYGRKKVNKATIVLWCKLGIRSNVNESSLRNSVNGGISLTNMTGETVDIFEYLDFVLYEKLRFKDNYGLSPSEPGR